MVNANPFDNELRPVVLEALERAGRLQLRPPPAPADLSELSFCRETWSAQLDGLAGLLHHAVTKFTLAANAAGSARSAASSVGQPARTLRTHLFQTAGALEAFPASRGGTLHRDARALARELLLNCAALVNSFLSVPVREEALERHTSAFGATGVVWAGARAVKKLPRTNRRAVARRWSKVEDLVEDARREFGEDLEDLAGPGRARGGASLWDDDDDGGGDEIEDRPADGDGVGTEREVRCAGAADSEAVAPEPSLEEQLAAGRELQDVLALTRQLFKEVGRRCLRTAASPASISPSPSSSSLSSPLSSFWTGRDVGQPRPDSDSEQEDDEDDVGAAGEAATDDTVEVIALQDEVLRLGSALASKVDDLVFHFDGPSAAAPVPPVSPRRAASPPPPPPSACFAARVVEFGGLLNQLADAAENLWLSSRSGSTNAGTRPEWFADIRNRFASLTVRWRRRDSRTESPAAAASVTEAHG